ncbi:MAG: acid phosphatase type 7 [Verrucomicrobiota bacterium]|jgi:hypothetical protein
MTVLEKYRRNCRCRNRAWWVCFVLYGFLQLPAHAASGALQFDGVNDYVTFGPAPGLGLSALTLEAWIKRTGAGMASSSGSGGVIAVPLITKGRGEADGSNLDCNYFFGLRSTDFVLAADFEEGAGGVSPGLNHPITGTTVLATGAWYHVATTYDGTNWALYLDGQLEGQLAVGRPLRSDSIQHAALAAALQSTGAPEGAFAGLLDEVRIWNYARSASQIASNRSLQIASATGLVGRWSLDDGAGITATNTGSSALNGTLTNGPTWVAGYPFAAAPSVTLTNPVAGTVVTNPATLLFGVSAFDPDGSVTNVGFFTGSNLIGNSSSAPFAFTWANAPVGVHSLSAVAADNSGLTATSAPINLTVQDSIVQLISPVTGSRFLSPAVISLAADVSEANGTVSAVEFYAGTTSLGSASSAPWHLNWPASTLGTYLLTAVAIHAGGMHTSAPVTVQIATNIPPSVSITNPLSNAVLGTPGNLGIFASASDSDGSVTQVTFFTNGVLYAIDATPPFSVTWTNPPVGSHVLTAAAADNDGATQLSAGITVHVVNARLTRGPYLQQGTPFSAILRWRTDIATDGRVRFGLDPNFLTNTADETALTNDHTVRLSGLEPESRYYYSAGSSAVTLGVSTNYFLVTPPLPGTNRPVRAWVLGDPGTQDANQRAVRDAFYNYATNSPRADLVLLLGDNAYQNGTDAEYQSAIFDIYTNVLRNTFLWSCIGNHDTAQSATPAPDIPYFKLFTFPANGEAGGMPSGTEKYYSWDHANIHFVCLDSMTSSRAANGAMANWLRSDLGSTTQKWVIAIYHHPAYSKGSHDSDVDSELKEMRQNIAPILEAYGVDLTLAGHSHCYERSYLISGHYGLASTFTDAMKVDGGSGRTNGTGAYSRPYSLASKLGAIYCTTGSAGQTAGGALNHPAMFVSANTLGSVVLDIDGDRLDMKFLTSAGVVQDYFTILKGNQAVLPATPTNLTATLVGSNQIRLAWANVATNELGWEIDRSIDGATFSRIVTLGANLLNYTNGPLSLATTWFYRIRATNSVGASDWSTIASAATLSLPGTPGSFAATVTATNQITVAWINTASNAASLRLERSLDGISFSLLAPLATNVTSYANGGLAYATPYYYRLRSENLAGVSSWTPVANATTPAPPVVTVGGFSPIFQGIEFAAGTNFTGGFVDQVVRVMRVDLSDTNIQFRTTPPIVNPVSGSRETAGQTTTEFLTSQNLQAAINANYFSPCCGQPSGAPFDLVGLAISDGQLVSPQESADYSSTLFLPSNNVPLILHTNWPPINNAGVRNAVTGRYPLVIGGVKVGTNDTLNPRTAIGYSQDRRYLILLTIDGRQPGYSDGAADIDTAAWMVRYGAYEAVNLDGGGSTTMAISDGHGGATLLNRPIHNNIPGTERVVGNHLGIYARAFVPAGIATQPQSQVVNAGSLASFSVIATGSPPISYQWRFNGAPVSGATNASLILTNAIDAQAGIYSVVVGNTNSVVSALATLVINHPPSAPTVAVQRAVPCGVKLLAEQLLGSDIDGDVTELHLVGPASAGGGSVTRVGRWVVYAPPNLLPESDSFSYQLTDGRGGAATASVSVTIGTDNGPSANVVVEDLNNGSLRLRCSGIPGRPYFLQYTTVLSNPSWQPLAGAAADAQGAFEFIDTPPPGTPRFYRTIYP